MAHTFQPAAPYSTFLLDRTDPADRHIGPYGVAYVGLPHQWATSDFGDFLLIGRAFSSQPVDAAELSRLVEKVHHRTGIFEQFAYLTGHFVLLAWNKAAEELVAMTDTGAQMTLYYDRGGQRLAGQIRELLCYKRNRPWTSSDQQKSRSLFGRTMPWEGVCRIMPNHALVIQQDEVAEHRYYPLEPLAPQSAEAAVEKSARWLQESISALPQSSTLFFSITAGLDSRACLAGMPTDELHRVRAYVRVKAPTDKDAVAAQTIAEKLHIPLHALEKDAPAVRHLAPSFVARHFDFQVMNAPTYHFPDFEEPVFMVGNVAEAFKTNYARPQSNQPKKWLKELGAPRTDRTLKDMAAWIEETKSLPAGWHRSDLLYWEWRLPNFLQPFVFHRMATPDLYYAPLAHRHIIETMLGMPPKQRMNNRHVALEQLGNLALGGQRVPYNPDLKSRALYAMQKWGLYLPYRLLRFYIR